MKDIKLQTEICSACKKETYKWAELPIVESPKDYPHNEPFCLKCAADIREEEYETE